MNATTIQALILWLGAALMIGLILWDYLRYKVHLLSFRNLMLAGFVVYQMLSPSYTLFFLQPESFHIDDLTKTGWVFLLYVIVFLVVFLVTYRMGWGVKGVAQNFPVYRKELSDNSMVIIAVVAMRIPNVAFNF